MSLKTEKVFLIRSCFTSDSHFEKFSKERKEQLDHDEDMGISRCEYEIMDMASDAVPFRCRAN